VCACVCMCVPVCMCACGIHPRKLTRDTHKPTYTHAYTHTHPPTTHTYTHTHRRLCHALCCVRWSESGLSQRRTTCEQGANRSILHTGKERELCCSDTHTPPTTPPPHTHTHTHTHTTATTTTTTHPTTTHTHVYCTRCNKQKPWPSGDIAARRTGCCQ
jgi:hypothetical protein